MDGVENGSDSELAASEAIAAVVYEAATEGKDQFRYQAGTDAVASHAQRLAVGPDTLRQGVAAQFGLSGVAERPQADYGTPARNGWRVWRA